MNKKYFCLGAFVLALLILLFFPSGKADLTGYLIFQDEEFKLGHCPTMKEAAEFIGNQNPSITLVEFGSTSATLANLNSENINIALVGRKAKSYEVGDAHERVLGEGVTLITQSKQLISYDQLEDLRIFTYLDKEIFEEQFPNLNIEVSGDKEELLQSNYNIVLISWEDYEDYMELLVPLNQDGGKVKEFRIPVLYSRDKKLLEEIIYE
ncbi:hypothetical protein KAS08_03190 [Candidatus Pacearchaeota archaeon]|nr:hypothetical protein [Candidatus Pacearchaeota archaeon]